MTNKEKKRKRKKRKSPPIHQLNHHEGEVLQKCADLITIVGDVVCVLHRSRVLDERVPAKERSIHRGPEEVGDGFARVGEVGVDGFNAHDHSQLSDMRKVVDHSFHLADELATTL